MKLINHIAALATEYGCTVTDVKRGKHFKIYLDTPSGKQILVCSVSTSDRRAAENNRGLFRKWSRK